MKKELETRAYGAEFGFGDESDGTIIEGTPIVFNSRTDIGYFDEIIEAGALDEADLTDVRLCLNHDTSYVYARSRRNNPNSTMQLAVTSEGLRISAKLDTDSSERAKDFVSMIRRGDIDKMSFMFSIDEDRWEDLESDHPTRHILKIGSVVEVSAVTFPAYDTTEINARSKEALDNARSAVDTARQLNAKSVDTDNSLELAKAKFDFTKQF
jgi:HK97 family phage prohead protease